MLAGSDGCGGLAQLGWVVLLLGRGHKAELAEEAGRRWLGEAGASWAGWAGWVGVPGPGQAGQDGLTRLRWLVWLASFRRGAGRAKLGGPLV